jgi:hypothetical protein
MVMAMECVKRSKFILSSLNVDVLYLEIALVVICTYFFG